MTSKNRKSPEPSNARTTRATPAEKPLAAKGARRVEVTEPAHAPPAPRPGGKLGVIIDRLAGWRPGAWCRRRGGGVRRREPVGRAERNAA